MITEAQRFRLQAAFDQLNANPAFKEECRHAERQLKTRIAKRIRAHQRILTQSRAFATSRVIR